MAAEQETTRSPLVGSETTDYNTLFGERQEAKFARSTLFGKVRNIKRFSWVEWIFVVMASLSMLGVLGVIIERFIHFERHFFNLTIVNESTEVEELAKCNKWVCTTDFIFTMVLLLNLLFCAYYCYDGLFRERQFEMMSYAVATLVIVIYIIANYGVKWEEGQPIRLIRLVFACVLGPVNMVLAVLIWWRMGFLIFNTIGSNEALTRAYKIQSFFLTLQHFNLQVLVNIVALAWVNSGNFLPIGEKVILPILLVYALITMVIGLIAASFEVHRLSCVWYFLILPFFGYYVYKLTDHSHVTQKHTRVCTCMKRSKRLQELIRSCPDSCSILARILPRFLCHSYMFVQDISCRACMHTHTLTSVYAHTYAHTFTSVYAHTHAHTHTQVGVRWDDYSVSYVEYSRPKHISDSPVATATHFKYVGACLLIASSLGVIVCSLMEIFMFLSQRNFGKGLREKVTPPFEDIFLKCTCGQTDRDI